MFSKHKQLHITEYMYSKQALAALKSHESHGIDAINGGYTPPFCLYDKCNYMQLVSSPS